MIRSLASLALCGALILGAGCSDDSLEPEELGEPSLALTLAPVKRLELSWDRVPNALSYQLFVRQGLNGEPLALAPESDAQSASLEVALHRQDGRSYFVRACDALTCRDSAALELGGSRVEGIGYLKASAPTSGARFGSSVALSSDGSLLAIGAPREADETGAVYLFARDSAGTWVEHARVEASNAGSGDHFGQALALDPGGTFLIVGAPEEDGGENGTTAKSDSGAAYVFARGEADPDTGLDTWTEQAYLKAPNYDLSNLKINDRFGDAVDLDLNAQTVAIGASKEGQQGGSGAVYMFAADAEGWAHVVTLKAPFPDEDDAFGLSLALSDTGDVLAVGAPFEDSDALGVGGEGSTDTAPDSGATYVFSRVVDEGGDVEWDKAPVYLKASDAGSSANFGYVTLDGAGQLLAVGAPNPEAIGAAYLFERGEDGSWTELFALADPGPEGSRDQFGAAVALSGDGRTLVVTVPEDDSSARGVGGDEADITAFRAGGARVFTAPGQWTSAAPDSGVYLKASNSEDDDELGRAVALSDDGELVVLGAIGEDGRSAGVGGDAEDNGRSNAGAAYLY